MGTQALPVSGDEEPSYYFHVMVLLNWMLCLLGEGEALYVLETATDMCDSTLGDMCEAGEWEGIVGKWKEVLNT